MKHFFLEAPKMSFFRIKWELFKITSQKWNCNSQYVKLKRTFLGTHHENCHIIRNVLWWGMYFLCLCQGRSGGAFGTWLLGGAPFLWGGSGAAVPVLLSVPGVPCSGHSQSEAHTNFAAKGSDSLMPQAHLPLVPRLTHPISLRHPFASSVSSHISWDTLCACRLHRK